MILYLPKMTHIDFPCNLPTFMASNPCDGLSTRVTTPQHFFSLARAHTIVYTSCSNTILNAPVDHWPSNLLEPNHMAKMLKPKLQVVAYMVPCIPMITYADFRCRTRCPNKSLERCYLHYLWSPIPTRIWGRTLRGAGLKQQKQVIPKALTLSSFFKDIGYPLFLLEVVECIGVGFWQFIQVYSALKIIVYR